MQIVPLPGLDGTAKLFNRFIAAAPPDVSVTALALPTEALTYNQLADRIEPSLPNGQTVLIAESFSRPLALALAARRPFAGLVFCNSFVVAPRSRTLRWPTLPALFTSRCRTFCCVVTCSVQEPIQARSGARGAVASVPSSVLASRVRSVLTVDDASAFARCAVPTLYMRGTEDRLVPDSALGRMAAERQLSIARVPGPHLLLQANPAGALRVILPFLDSLAAAQNQSADPGPQTGV